jgi:FkbM family methyltransferase
VKRRVAPVSFQVERTKRLLRAALPDPAYRLYRRWRVDRLVDHFEPAVVTHRYAGFELRVTLEDPLAREWYDHDWPQLPELEVLRGSRLAPGALVFDVGAHQGVLALVLARIVGAAGRVVAVELAAHNAVLAAKNVALNEATNVSVVHAAVASAAGFVRSSHELNAAVIENVRRDFWGTDAVRAVTIDSLAREYGAPEVVVVDVEGAEVRALDGAHEILERARSDWLVEIHSAETYQPVLRRFSHTSYHLSTAPVDRGARFAPPAREFRERCHLAAISLNAR